VAGCQLNARFPPTPESGPEGAPVLDDKGKPKKLAAATWLDRNRPVEQMTWAPGEPPLIRDRSSCRALTESSCLMRSIAAPR
jgi:hypothetical protein